MTKAKRHPQAARSRTERDYHRHEAAKMYLQGYSQHEIGKGIGVSLSTVKRDLEAVRAIWLESATQALATHKAEQLAKLDVIESEAWTAWRRSNEKPVNSDTGTYSNGEAKYLTLALQCVDRRCKLLGLDSPDKVEAEIHSSDTVPDRYKGMTPEEREARIDELIELRERERNKPLAAAIRLP